MIKTVIMQNIVGEAIGVSLNHLCYFFLTRILLEIFFFSEIDTIKKFPGHLYISMRLTQLLPCNGQGCLLELGDPCNALCTLSLG